MFLKNYSVMYCFIFKSMCFDYSPCFRYWHGCISVKKKSIKPTVQWAAHVQLQYRFIQTASYFFFTSRLPYTSPRHWIETRISWLLLNICRLLKAHFDNMRLQLGTTDVGIISKSSYANCRPAALCILYLSDMVSLNRWNRLWNKYELDYFGLLQHIQYLSLFVMAAVKSVLSFDPEPTWLTFWYKTESK